MKDNLGNDLIAGRVYCMVTGKDGFPSYGALAWYCADGELYDANYKDCEGDVISHYDYDYLVLQPGNINTDYV